MAKHNELGKWGEKIAEDFLKSKGMEIIERDWKSGHRDIDIIAIEDNVIHFVEVKTRRDADYADPIITLPYSKRKNLMASINHYIKSKNIDLDYQIDLITIIGNISQVFKIEYLDDIRIM